MEYMSHGALRSWCHMQWRVIASFRHNQITEQVFWECLQELYRIEHGPGQ